MFFIVFVFSCILQVLEENPSNSKIIMKSSNSLLERIKCQIKFDFKKKRSRQNLLFLEGIQNEDVSVFWS
jgi:hypothetical protein